MEPTRKPNSLGRLVGGAVLAGVLVAGGAAGYLVLRSDDNDGTAVATDDTATAGSVLSAEAGVAARAERSQFGPAAAGGVETAAAKVAAADATSLGCGPADGEDYTPTAEELAAANADTDALAAVFDTFGVAYTRSSDPFGYTYLNWDTNDVVAQSVSDSFWADRYPTPPISQEDLDRARAENDVIARHLDAAGVRYTRTTSPDGWELLEYDYEDPTAQQAVDEAYAELYPPVAPSAEEKAAMTAENDKLAAAFDRSGVPYTRMTDELGWEWIEWDYEDPVTQSKVDAVFAELYPPAEGGCLAGEGGPAGGVVADGAADGAVTLAGEGAERGDAVAAADGSTSVSAVDETVEPIDDFAEPTPEQTARRDAEAAALVAGFGAAGVRNELIGESPWQSVQFDITNQAAVPVVADILAARA